MTLKTEDGNDLEKYLAEIARELDAILKGKVSSCQLMKNVGKSFLNFEVLFQIGYNFFG